MGNNKDANKASPVSGGVTRRDFLRLGARGRGRGACWLARQRLGRGLGRAREERGQNWFHPADRLRQRGDRVGNGL